MKINSNIITDNKTIKRFCLDRVPESIKNLYKELEKNIGCNYITYIYEDFLKNEVVYFSTNPEWQEIYVITGLINNCHIYLNAIENSKKSLYPIVWNSMSQLTKIQKEVDEYRKSKNIANGIGFLQKNDNFRESFSFASNTGNTNFHKNFIDAKTVKYYLEVLREINSL